MKIREVKKLLATVALAGVMVATTACNENKDVVVDNTIEDEVKEPAGPQYNLEEPKEDKGDVSVGNVSDDAEIENADEQAYEDWLEAEQAEKLERESASEFTVTPYQQVMYATSKVNFREGPSTETARLGQLKAGDSITTTGKVEESDWYEFEQSDGTKAYVSGAYLSETKPTVQTNNNSNNGMSDAELQNWLDNVGNVNAGGSIYDDSGYDPNGGTDLDVVNDGSLDYLPPAH